MQFKDAFTARQEGGGTRAFKRYDLITFASLTNGAVRFQWVDPNKAKDHGIGAGHPFYTAAAAALIAHLISPFECLQGLYRGLGLAKQVEWTVRHGKIVWDFDSKATLDKLLPIERHIQAGDLHVVATYDPKAVFGGGSRSVAVNNFAGVQGLNVTFPADAQVRIFLVGIGQGG